MRVLRVHVSYSEWLLETVIQIGGTTAVFHNKLRLVQSQWLRNLSEQSVLGLHDIQTFLPVTFTHEEHSRKMFITITLKHLLSWEQTPKQKLQSFVLGNSSLQQWTSSDWLSSVQICGESTCRSPICGYGLILKLPFCVIRNMLLKAMQC